MAPMELEKSLVSNNNASDSQLQVQLHPLVILTISDYVTRHTLRRQKGPIVGAILGAQNGREVTMEYAFDCKLEQTNDDRVVIDLAWFHDRLQQHKEVHKVPLLDLVGWFTLAPPSGPQPQHVHIHQQLLEQYNESTLLLAFHPTLLLDGTTKGSKLPITVYETSFESNVDGGDQHMAASGEAGPQLVIRFKEIPYTIETGDAEMISVDFVAKGAANATVTDGAPTAKVSPSTTSETKDKAKGKSRTDEDPGLDVDILSPEDEELISTLSTKANAIRMLQQRIAITRAYIDSIPPCYLNTPRSTSEPVVVEPHPQISHPILRSINATLSRLPLLTPQANVDTTSIRHRHTTSLTHESAQQKSDVALVSLLGNMGSTLKAAQDMGKKASVVERARVQATQMHNAFAGNKGKSGGSYPLRGSHGDDFAVPGDMAAYTPPMEMDGGDEGYVDDYDGQDLYSENNASWSGGVALPAADTSGGALRGKGKGLMRGMKKRPDEDEEMT